MAVRADAPRPGDQQAELLLEHRAFVERLCRILLRGLDEAEDAAQQVFLNAFRALDRGVHPADARAWLAQIARNECRSRLRSAAVHPEAPLPDTLPAVPGDTAELAAQHALVARLREELAGLPERQREALVLREFRGLSYDELAAAMNETGPAVESLLQRARRRLMSRLEEARRPFVWVALAFDSVRSVGSRLAGGPAVTEAVTAGGTAAVVAKLTAAGVVAVGVGVAGGGSSVSDVVAPPSPATHRFVRPPVADESAALVPALGRSNRITPHAPAVQHETRGPSGHGSSGTPSGGSRQDDDVRGGESGPPVATGSADSSGHGRSTAVTTSSSEGAGSGSEASSSSGPSDHLDPSGPGSSAPGSSGSGDSGSNSGPGSGSDSSGSDDASGHGDSGSSGSDD